MIAYQLRTGLINFMSPMLFVVLGTGSALEAWEMTTQELKSLALP